MTQKVKIVKMEPRHASQVAALHIIAIPIGFISSLGQKFVTALYEAIVGDSSSFGFVAVKGGKVIGFVAFTTSLSSLYKSVIRKRGFRFMILLASKMFSLKRIKKFFQTFFYPCKVGDIGVPDAELLAIAVTAEGQGKGVAKQLIQKGFYHYSTIGIDQVKVLVAADNQSANLLYKKTGFELNSQIDSHGVKSNLYVATIKKDLQAHLP